MVTRALGLALMASAAMQLGYLMDYEPGEFLVTSIPLSPTLLSTLYVYGGPRFEGQRVTHQQFFGRLMFQYSA